MWFHTGPLDSCRILDRFCVAVKAEEAGDKPTLVFFDDNNHTPTCSLFELNWREYNRMVQNVYWVA